MGLDEALENARDTLASMMQTCRHPSCFLLDDGRPHYTARFLGEKLYAAGGDRMLHACMDALLGWVERENNNSHYVYLRELEVCWSGIGRWQA